MTAAAIKAKVDRGVWRTVVRGIYEVAGSVRTWRRSVMGCVLGAGDGAVASHNTAARLHELIDHQPTTVDVTVPHRRHPKPMKGRRTHRTRTLTTSDVTRVDAIPVTSVPRTLLDLAGILSDERLEAIVDAALASGRTSTAAMRRYLKASCRTHHVRRLVRLLDDRELGVPESELERAFERLITRAKLPMPPRQRSVARYRVDYAYEAQHLVIEVDGSATRSTKAQLQKDRRRQNAIVLERQTVLRFTWDDVTKDAPYVVETIGRALDGAGGGS